ncbi:MAG: hypothetical protein ABL961_14315 [Vicinamibacterales bacterium]
MSSFIGTPAGEGERSTENVDQLIVGLAGRLRAEAARAREWQALAEQRAADAALCLELLKEVTHGAANLDRRIRELKADNSRQAAQIRSLRAGPQVVP